MMEICDHGSLKRKCHICDLEEEARILREALEKIAQEAPLGDPADSIGNVVSIAKKALEESR